MLDTILLEVPRLWGIKLYDVDLWELLFRLALTLLVSYILIMKVYRATRKDSEYLFTYMVFSPLIYFICHLFSKVELSMGFAFGLFAIFSILRYRTTTIQVKEITYMFIIMAVAVINALSTKKVSYAELLFTNIFIVSFIYGLEYYLGRNVTQTRIIFYDNADFAHTDKSDLLIKDLNEKLGLNIIRFEILDVDYLKDSARIRIYYKE